MKTRTLVLNCVALLALAALPSQLLAEDPSTMPDAKYHLAISKTHNVHANDNAILLRKYAAAHKTVPADVMKEYTGALNFHLQAARKSHANLVASTNSPGKYSPGCVDRRMRSQNDDVSRYFASREQLGCEFGEGEECHDGILPRAAKVQSDLKNQAELLKQIDLIDKRLTKISGMVKKLESEGTEATVVAAESAAISKELIANRTALQSVDDNFYNMQASNHYEEGLGHFAD